MPVPSSDFKKALKRLPESDKEALLLRAVRRDAELYETYRFELLADVTLAQIQEEAADRIHELFNVAVSGRLLNRSLVKALRASVQEAARARRITKSKQLEVDLLVYILRQCIDNYSGQFDSVYDGFFNATARLAARLPAMILKNLHEDLWLEYKEELDEMLSNLHNRSKSRHLKFELPRHFSIPE
ncbi:hypothetical protein AUC43_16610 [Hymenobacter sedentarius]|uniref:Uncharacterized protein n=1 Tax=Hymenobacter sedentarius TaxID=1411621 RepID=A0A0U3K1W2_9BACT|nr:hypothetical protein [Hymenobacter sedentarius]ALW86559.1 hypothetical protein AUC43_16610 [Hymenobacter sedentarius]